MSILGRFTNIMSYNVKSLFNKSKNPRAEINKYIEQLELDLGTIKSEADALLVQENRIRRELDDCEDTIDKYDRYAKKANENGKVRDAKIYLSKKESLMPRYNALREAYDKAEGANNKYSQMQDKLISDIAELKTKLSEFDSVNNEAKTSEVKDKLDNMKYAAEALVELNNMSSNNVNDDNLDAEFEKLLNEGDK